MLKRLAVLLALAIAALAGWLYVRGSKAPEVTFGKATRGRLESTVTTNGKVEPVEWVAVRAEAEGLVENVAVSRGQTVKRGQVLATIEARQARADLMSAEAKIAQAMAEIQTLESGGRSGDVAEIESGLKRAELDRDLAKRDLESLTRLQQKKAATSIEVQEAADRLARAQSQIQALNSKRSALVSRSDLAAAQARMRDAQATATLAKEKIALAAIRAPIDGAVYQLDTRAGAYLTPGMPVASVGRIDKLKVIVYIDEPELGRVRAGMPVTITWDALSGREWKGMVDRTPTQIVALGTRQVGEVTCVIDNPDRTLLPGTNVNASIQSQSVQGAITIPKESVIRDGGQAGVWLLEGTRVRWRPVQLGVASITRAEVAQGLKEGDEVALPSAIALREGLEVMPSRRAESPRRSSP